MSDKRGLYSITDIGEVRARTFLAAAEHYAQLGSTNDRALELAAIGSQPTPALIVADSQSRGRGRGPNRWWADRGALTFSLLVEAAAWNLAPDRWPRVSLTAGLAVCEALHTLLPGADVGLKWPNDVFLGGRKVCGILIEAPPSSLGRMVIGVGINVNNSFADAPAELRNIGVSISDSAGYGFPLSRVLTLVLQSMERRLESLTRGDGDLSEHWRTYCMLHGRNVTVQAGGVKFAGECQGIDHEGALVLAAASGLQRCYAGAVVGID